MNLESIEEHSLNYLSQVSNPLVRVEVLHAHLRDHGLVDDMDCARLRSFLESHMLVRIMQTPVGLEIGGQGSNAPEPGDAYAILSTRVPTQAQTSAMMLEQLLALEQALVTARIEALDLDDSDRVASIEEALRRLSGLRKKLETAPGSKQSN